MVDWACKKNHQSINQSIWATVHTERSVPVGTIKQAGAGQARTAVVTGARRAVQLLVFQLIINGNKLLTTYYYNRLITAVISDYFHPL